MKKIRADELLLQLGLVESRTKGQALIMTGEVQYKDLKLNQWLPIKKPGQMLGDQVEMKLLNEGLAKDVGRGAQKLRRAFEAWPEINTKVLRALDIGSSTGGFTQVMLEAGAAKVVALDVGTHQLHERLRSDSRVISVENQHVLRMGPTEWKHLGVIPQFALIVTDLSFISLTKIIDHVIPWLEPGASWIMLVKPQFELTAAKVPGGVVKKSEYHEEALQSVKGAIERSGKLCFMESIESPIRGGSGNKEFLLWVKRKEEKL